jgi:hypothetical protein
MEDGIHFFSRLQLAQYHAKDSNNLFMVRIAQGLVHMGKGTMSLNPFHSDSQVRVVSTLHSVKNWFRLLDQGLMLGFC